MTGIATAWESVLIELDAHRPKQPSDQPDRTADAAAARVPVTLVTGFLGAGKTTLLASLLAKPPEGIVIRAVVNDVGSLPFDPALVGSSTDVEIQLTNGCGCCQGVGDLAVAIGRAADGADVVVLEASGMADPLALAQVIEADDRCRLDRVVTVVDAVGWPDRRRHPVLQPIIERQLEGAEVVVVSGADRVAPDTLHTTVEQLGEAAPGRVIVTSSLTEPADRVLLPGALRGARLPVERGVAEPGHRLATTTVHADRRFRRAELEAVVADRPGSIVRGKGRIDLVDGSAMVQITPSDATITTIEADGDTPSQLLLVGTDDEELGCFAAHFRSDDPYVTASTLT